MKSKTWSTVAGSAKNFTKRTYTPLAPCSALHTHLTYYPIYKQPPHRSFSSSTVSTASPQLELPERQIHLPLNHHKSLPLFDFFSKSIAKPTPSYIFAHGASGFAKSRHRYTTPDNKQFINKNNEHYYSIQIGEDAYFRRSDAIGVADGVGGWTGVSGNK